MGDILKTLGYTEISEGNYNREVWINILNRYIPWLRKCKSNFSGNLLSIIANALLHAEKAKKALLNSDSSNTEIQKAINMVIEDIKIFKKEDIELRLGEGIVKRSRGGEDR